MHFLYELLFILGYLAYIPGAILRKRLPHPGWTMRLGRYPSSLKQRLVGKRPVWVHAVSVGEMLAAKPLLAALANKLPDEPAVLSSITPGGFGLARQHVGDKGVALYWPMDLRPCVKSAFDWIQPRMLLLIEAEFWPTVLREAGRRQIPVVVANGRVSERAYRRGLLVRPWMAGMLRNVQLFLMQSERDAQRIRALGAPPERVRVVGSLKWDASIRMQPTPDAIKHTADRISLPQGTPVVVAGSTHRGEEAAIAQAAIELRKRWPLLRLIVAPRHLERVAEVEAAVRQHRLKTLRWSQTPSSAAWDVLIVDTFGLLPSFYALASAVFIGGSLIRHGGQNPLEAAGLGKPVVFGPSMENFSDIAALLEEASACRRVSGASELGAVIGGWLSDPEAAETAGGRARALVERSLGATQRTLEALAPLLEGNG